MELCWDIWCWLSDNLSRTSQEKVISAAEGQTVANLTITTLSRMRSDENFDLFWEKVLKMCTDFEVEEPHLPRQHKVPKRYEVGIAEPEFPLSVVEHYRRIYYQATGSHYHLYQESI